MAAIGVEALPSGLGHSSRDCFTVPVLRAAASASRPTPDRMSMAKRLSAGSGVSRATARVFSPMTQLGARGTRQPHSGHVVSVQ